MWGAKMGERVSFTVMNGRVWLHVFVNRKHVASIGVRPDQAVHGATAMDQGARLAQIQDEEYRARYAQNNNFGFEATQAEITERAKARRPEVVTVTRSAPTPGA